jgi:hypothetical protein
MRDNQDQISLDIKTLALEKGYSEAELLNIYQTIPLSDTEDMTYLDLVGQAVLMISSLVDQKFADAPREKRLVEKYLLTAKLLQVKALVLNS